MTKKNKFNRLLYVVLSFVLVAAMALTMAACGGNSGGNTTETPVESTSSANVEVTEVGEGEHSFTFTATDLDGNKQTYSVKTDEKTVGAALVALGLISGDDSEFGLYVKTVCGTTLDYDKDGAYWAFYVGSDYASAGVDSTDIVDGTEYAFTATKG